MGDVLTDDLHAAYRLLTVHGFSFVRILKVDLFARKDGRGGRVGMIPGCCALQGAVRCEVLCLARCHALPASPCPDGPVLPQGDVINGTTGVLRPNLSGHWLGISINHASV